MSKGWKVKVETNVVFTVGTEMYVVAPDKVKAGIRAQELIERYLDDDDHPSELEKVLPWILDMGGLDWTRRPRSGEIDFDTMQSVLVEPDPDFDPEEDEEDVPEDAAKVRDLMEAAQCLNECYYRLADDHPLREWQAQHGIAEVRDQINLCAIYCEGAYRIVKDEFGFDGCFDFDFCPCFLENCVDHQTFKPRSENLDVLSMYWKLG
jgi:hypothetical protein